MGTREEVKLPGNIFILGVGEARLRNECKTKLRMVRVPSFVDGPVTGR